MNHPVHREKHAVRVGLEEMISLHHSGHTLAARYLEASPGDLRGLAALLVDASLDAVMIYAEPTTEQLLARIENAEQGGSRQEPASCQGSDRFIVLIIHGLPLFPRDAVGNAT